MCGIDRLVEPIYQNIKIRLIYTNKNKMITSVQPNILIGDTVCFHMSAFKILYQKCVYGVWQRNKNLSKQIKNLYAQLE